MKRTFLNITAVLILFFAVACKKYLEANAQSNYVYVNSVSDCQALLDDYNTMNTAAPFLQIISSDEYYATDLTLNQLAESAYYRWDALVQQSAGPSWMEAYKSIYVANLVLENLDKLRKGNQTAELANAEGGALFHRAFHLWFIAQLHAKPYQTATAASDPGIPVMLTSDLNEKVSRGSVQKTYDQVINDLKKAVTLLPDTALIVTRPSKVAAYGMLARVYLSMGDYGASQEYATRSLAIRSRLIDFSTLSTTTNTPFIRFHKEVIFHAISKANSAAAILVPGTGTGGRAKIAPELINSYSAQDLRSQVFFEPNTGIDAGTYRFTGNYEGVTGASFFEGIAVDEVYLTRAECYARLGNASAAMEDLNTLLKTRFVNTTATPYVPLSAASASEALRIILAERKKELVMRGLRWTDLRRLNLDPATAVTLIRVANGVTYTLPPNDLRYTLLIPKDVVDNTVIQNPR